MKQEMVDALAGFTTNAIDVLNTMTDTAIQQLPDVLRELILWARIISCVHIAIWLFGLIIVTICAIQTIKNWRVEVFNDEWWPIARVLIAIFGAVILGGTIVTKLGATILPLVAPKVYLIDYCANLIK